MVVFLLIVKDMMWFMVSMLFFYLFVTLGRFELAAATWAWHSIKTGKAFAWPLRRVS
jgi:hypothetical protein